MLYMPAAFEALTDERWDEERARERIRMIVTEAQAAFDPVLLWPADDEWDTSGGRATLPLTCLS